MQVESYPHFEMVYRPDFPLFCIDWHCPSHFKMHFSADGVSNVLMSRFLQVLPIFLECCRRSFQNNLVINLSDEGYAGQVAFCAKIEEKALLIPDNHFMGSRGYLNEREHFQANALSWAERNSVPFWRGTATGHWDGIDPSTLPRARFCEVALSLGMDVGLANIPANHPLSAYRADYISTKELGRRKYNIDIDGNTSSWPGLFLKLLSGSCVIKVESDFKQWYYDRLEPWLNYVPVLSDFSDLSEKIQYLEKHPDEAEIIANAGKDLALSLTYENEIAGACNMLIEHSKNKGERL